MCGIAGAIARNADVRVATVTTALTRALAHRGPDGEGQWSLGGDGVQQHETTPAPAMISLGHRRLSIVDVACGAQPMTNERGTVWVSFNGEIYNHLELRASLERAGHSFRTRADTEVLVHGWEEWGTALFGKLNGIFAIALCDTTSRRVILARDPMGVKPLYVGVEDGMTWWSSELAPAMHQSSRAAELDPDALKLFLTFRFIPAPFAAYRNSWKIPPGHLVTLDDRNAGQTPAAVPFATEVTSAHEPGNRDEWREAMAQELEASVGRQLMSDVPVGSLLSGGVDSSVVTRLMKKSAGESPASFAIGFADSSVTNELAAARLAASELDVPLTEVAITDEQYLSAWPEAIRRLGEPVANPGQLLVGLLCAAVQRTHKVVLTGQGADEPLGGYPRHMAARLWKLGRLAPALSARVARALIGADAGRRLGRVLAQTTQLDRTVELLSVISPETVDSVVPGNGTPARELARSAVAQWLREEDERDPLNALLRVDARMSLADDLLIVADHFSMRSSVELRVPFLDLAFVELVERMPSRYKVSMIGERKWLYRRAARSLLPESTARRLCGWRARLGRKQGFSTPLDTWFTGSSASTPAGGKGSDRLRSLLDWRRIERVEQFRGPRERYALFSLASWVGEAT